MKPIRLLLVLVTAVLAHAQTQVQTAIPDVIRADANGARIIQFRNSNAGIK
jgi:hypothetical protein